MRTAAASEMGSCKQEQTVNASIKKTKNKTHNRNLLIQVHFNISRINDYENKPSIADDETAKHCPNSSSGSSYSDCSSSSSDKLGSSVNVPADSTGLEAPQCDLGERALWHHSNIALKQENKKREKKDKL